MAAYPKFIYLCESAFIPASASQESTIILPAGTNITIRNPSIIIKDDIPKRLGGKDLSRKQINKLRYG